MWGWGIVAAVIGLVITLFSGVYGVAAMALGMLLVVLGTVWWVHTA